MRTLILLSFVPVLLASCTRYQYATISGQNVSMNDHSEFVAESDTLQLRYNFNGQNAPVKLTIENKLDVPVYIDWRQSSLVVNDKAISYSPNDVQIAGALSAARDLVSQTGNYPSYSGTINATASLPLTTDFIPPHSHITKIPLGLTNYILRNLPDSVNHRIKTLANDGNYYNVRQAKFTESSSPLRFRSYLTVMVGEAASKPVVYQHAFYVSELVTTGLNPAKLGYVVQGQGNQYYIRQATGFGKAATGFGVIAGTAVIAGATQALMQSTNTNSYQNNNSYH